MSTTTDLCYEKCLPVSCGCRKTKRNTIQCQK